MCGIVGFTSTSKKESILEKMLAIQSHRGSDHKGIFVEKVASNYIHFGHNRLAIQDTSTFGNQPFISDCKQYIITYNGEVYNFKTIQKELKKLGYTFKSSSDTEVILYAYKEWGIDCLQKFIGMFAFSILDKRLNKIFLVRDRAGVKPLYYYVKNNELLFASELKSFHYHPSFKKELNKEVLPYYFQFGYIPTPHSIFKNTYKLESGHYLEFCIENSQYKTIEYWLVDECYKKEKFDKSEVSILNDLEELLTDAVEKRMISDVPVGVFLSGGYDSTLITALLSKNSSRKLNTYTIGFNSKNYNEANHAKTVAKYFNTNHTEYYVSKKDMLDRVESLPFYYDEPFADSSSIPTMLVSSLAKRDVTVALSGDGGDEAFCGYSKYFFLNKFSNIFASNFKRDMLNLTLSKLSVNSVKSLNSLLPNSIRQTNIEDKYTKFKRAISSNSLENMFLEASSYVDSKDVARLLKIKGSKKIYKNFSMNPKESFLNEMMRVDYKTFMSDDVLTKVDRATMSVSLEGREPLLDHRIIEYMARVPVELKYKNSQPKYLARQILYKYIPRPLVDKPKAGFQVPLQEWLQKDLRYLVEKYLNILNIDDEIFNPKEIEKLKEELFLGNSVNVSLIWFIISYEMWKERWFNGK